jgi:hypothetical protein
MSISLLQLVAMNSPSYKKLKIKSNYVSEFITNSFYNDDIIIGGECDILCPEFLEIELNPNIGVDEFKNICHKICFVFKIDNKIIFNIPLRFMMLLKEYDFIDNKFYITIPFEIFCDNIQIVSLINHQIKFSLLNTENNLLSCKLISKHTYYDTDERREIHYNIKHLCIQFLSSVELNCKKSSKTFVHEIDDYGLYKGFFIECENVDEISEIIFLMGTELNNLKIRTNYNCFLVKAKCIKINKNLLYFPLNCEKSYKGRNSDDFEGLLDLMSLSIYCEIIIKFNCLQSKICIYNLCAGSAVYDRGLFIMSPFLQENNHIYKEYYEKMDGIEIYKPITDVDKSICNITLENIKNYSKYMICENCNNIYDELSIKQWLQNNNKCPICREIWMNFNIYINGFLK